MARHGRRDRTEITTKAMWRIGLLLAFIGLLLLFFMPGRGLLHYRNLRKQAEALRTENQQLRDSNQKLDAEIKRLKTDDKYLEELARKEYGLLKKNEEVYEFKSSGSKK